MRSQVVLWGVKGILPSSPPPSSGGVSEDILVAADRSAGRCSLINGSRAGVKPAVVCSPL